MEYFCHIPCGHSIPENNPHAVSVNLPTISDVTGYEEGDPSITEIMESAYPRFRQNRLVKKVNDHVRNSSSIPEEIDLLPVASLHAVNLIEKRIGKNLTFISSDGIDFIKLEKNSPVMTEIKDLLQHSGMIPSSRKAEDYLLKNKVIDEEYPENLEAEESAISIVKTVLSDGYGSSSVDDVFLCTSGSNALYTAFEALKSYQAKCKRNIFIQFGWLYSDSMAIIRKYSDKHSIFLNITDTDSLEAFIRQNNSEVACVITELPNNPLVQSPDLPRISEMLKAHNIPLLVDTTIGTAYNVEVMEYADIIVESLTKWACGNADVLMGAIVLNKSSLLAQELKEYIKQFNVVPYIKDIRRLAEEIKFYKERVRQISDNTLQFVDFLSTSKKVKKIHWALGEPSGDNYRKVMRSGSSVPGLISVIFDKELKYYYDRLPLAKGPSFGTEFTLAMPYIYMAHYDLLQTSEGKEKLKGLKIDPELLRISVGLEPIDQIIRIFDSL
ncbi:MAG: aminotransferase class I/II-fold pyridoxal phosphate-dependent enzyme [Bacteroidota bacterium]|nr:aminotransferase class I/II-fold pyridoxal phosphate-dependent enzyme [Bacteroidota bacterium]